MYKLYFKRVFDIVLAIAVLILASPVLALLAIAVKLASPGPAIFMQTRIGKNGQHFRFFKFRSMPVNTGDIASDKIGEIPLTRTARFIRRTNLDELPQLFNILVGDMSFVGPRPPIPEQRDLIAARTANGALNCLPGLTGLAQVNSFDGMTAAQKSEFDGRYANMISFKTDLSIILRTFGYLLRPPPKY